MVYPYVSGYAKKTTVQVDTLTYNDRHRINQTITVDEKENPSFAFLKISDSTHLPAPTSHCIRSPQAKECNFANDFENRTFAYSNIISNSFNSKIIGQ